MRPPTPLLTPAMSGLLDRIRRAGRPPFHAMTVEEARRTYALTAELLEPPRAPLPRVDELDVPGAAGPLPDGLSPILQ